MAGVKKRILITGAGGFVGKNLVEQLGLKYSILAPKRSELNLLDENQVRKYFEANKIDIVVHAAVVGGSRTEEYAENALNQNLRMFFNVIKQQERFKRMIFLGSGAEYDKSRPLIKIREIDFGDSIPIDEYGFAKFLCSKYIENTRKVVCLRIFGLFGKYEDYRFRFISNAICQNLRGKTITMNQNVVFDYVFIDDFVKIVDHFISHIPKERFYNIGSGHRIDLVTIANTINQVAKRKSKIVIKTKGLNKEYSCDNSRLRREIPHLRFRSYAKAIAQLHSWYSDYIKDTQNEN